MTYRLASVVLPIRDQADHIEGLVSECAAALPRIRLPFELVLVPNGCTDRSPGVCRALEKRHRFVRVVEREKPGWGLAVRSGLEHAQGDVLCYTNSARTRAEDLVLMLVYAIGYPGVVVKANRKIRDNWRRRLGSLLYNLECRSLFNLAVWDINGTPKVFPRSFQPLLELTRDDDLIDLEFNVVCRRWEYPMIEVPIFSNRRRGAVSTTNYRTAVRLYAGAFRLWRSGDLRA